jgi:hypothetical protein
MGTESLLAFPKPVLASYKNGIGQIVAWCIKRSKYLFFAIGVLVVLHFIQQMDWTLGEWKKVGTQRSFEEKTTLLPVWKKDEIIAENLPSLPYVSWKANKDKRWNLKCGQYPYIYDVSFFNTYWQTFKLQNYTVQIFGKDNKTAPFLTLFGMFGCTQVPTMTIERYLAGSLSYGSTL